MTDVATLTIKVDSKEVVAATKVLTRFNKVAKNTDDAIKDIKKTGQNAGANLNQGFQKAIPTTEKLKDNVKKTSTELNAFERGVQRVGQALIALAGVQTIRFLSDISDEATNINNKLALVTDGTEDLNGVFEQLTGVASRSRTSLSATADLYQKLALSSEELGTNQEELTRLTETISKSFALSGATAAEMDGAIRQLGQGLASGALRGDEFNSVAEQAPIIMRAIAKETGLTIGELREFAATGGITADIVVKALQAVEQEVDENFSKTAETTEQVIESIRNEYIAWARDAEGLNASIRLTHEGLRIVGDTGLDILKVIDSTATSFGKLADAVERASSNFETLETLMEGLNKEVSDLDEEAGFLEQTWVTMVNALKPLIPSLDNAAAAIDLIGSNFEEIVNAGTIDKVAEDIGKLEKRIAASTSPTEIADLTERLEELRREQDRVIKKFLQGVPAFTANERILRKWAKTGNQVVVTNRKITSTVEDTTEALVAEAEEELTFLMVLKEVDEELQRATKRQEEYEKALRNTGASYDSFLDKANAAARGQEIIGDDLVKQAEELENAYVSAFQTIGNELGGLGDLFGEFGKLVSSSGGNIGSIFSGGADLSGLITSGGNAVLTAYTSSLARDIEQEDYGQLLDKVLPGFFLGTIGEALGINFGGKPSDKTQTSQLQLGSGQITQGGFLSGEKFNERNREAADASVALLAQVAGRLGGLSGELDFIVGSRDGIRVEFDDQELFKSNDLGEALDFATSKLLELSDISTSVYTALQAEGETLAETFLRIETQFDVVSSVADVLGLSFTSLGDGGKQVADDLIQAAGGLEAFANKSAFFYDNFFTEQEKLEKIIGTSNDAIAAFNTEFGLTGDQAITSEASLRAYIEGLDELDEGYADQLNAALTLAPALVNLTDATEKLEKITGDATEKVDDLTESVDDLGEEAQETEEVVTPADPTGGRVAPVQRLQTSFASLSSVIENVSRSADDATDSLEDLTEEVDVVGNAYAQLLDAVSRQQDALADEFDADIEAINDRYGMVIDGLNDSLVKVNTNVRELGGLVSLIDNALNSSKQNASILERQQAQSQLTTALAIGRAGGSLTGLALEDAINTLAQPSAQLFSSFADFAFDTAVTNQRLTELKDQAERELTGEEKIIDLLERQIEEATLERDSLIEQREQQFEDEINRLDALVDAADRQLNALEGIDSSLLDLPAAITAFGSAIGDPSFGRDAVIRRPRDRAPAAGSTRTLDDETTRELLKREDLREVLEDTRDQARSSNVQLIKFIRWTYDIIEKWDIDGLPAERT